ncbi:MAG TPA: DNA-directed RNA polymerase subunit beta' [Anaerolineales bacterium]|nr:DNA-directed RNA polymerase subunit beta' [Anaerolineales bacterium]
METKDLLALRIHLASPETILSWSHGEVLKPETINYRRLRPEPDGLFCEKIFGPTRDYQCACGKFKNPRYKGMTCDKCGVQVTKSSVRRERMGHITLAAPVAHIWYTRRVPSYLGLLLDISRRNLERVLYFAQYVVTYVNEEARQRALKRLEEEIGEDERTLAAQINSRIASVKASRDKRLKELEAQRKQIETRYNEEVASRLEPIVKEGQRLESDLRERMGKQVRKAVLFGSTEIVIAQAGEVIGSEHIARVQQVVKDALTQIEAELKEAKQAELDGIEVAIQEVKARAEEAMERLRAELEEQEAKQRSEKAKLRDELLDLRPLTFMSEARYRDLKARWGRVFRADMGAEAFLSILRRLDLDKLAEELWHEVRTTKSKQKRKKAIKRLKVVEAFRRSGNRPEWMILTVLPVIPPDLRPMVQLDGGRFATSDLNDLYRRVINRNNRLKRLLELGAPDVIVRNEKRMLQEAVDSLIDNSQRGKALSRRGRRELKSLSDMLKGKKGRFRRNLLGKRVDYSGRSVIVVGPQLKLHQCGLPKTMALELYRPFVIARLVQYNYVNNVKGAKRFIERNRPEVWEVLEEVIKERPVLLNRAPTLHRLGIQAFEPVLVEGLAIQLHPLVCTAFNADFDGDQMAVHVPLSEKAVQEARELMLSSRNLLKPADGEPIISPSKDMVLGVYYLTMGDSRPHKGDGMVFSDLDEVEMAYALKVVDIHAKIRLRTVTWYDDEGNHLDEAEERIIETTVGRTLFNRILPDFVRFINRTLDKGGVKEVMALVYELGGEEATVDVADKVKDLGFKYATVSGVTMAVGDIEVPPEKEAILQKAYEEVDKIERAFNRGLLTEQEKNNRVIEIWQRATEEVREAVKKHLDPVNDLAVMAISGATKGGYGTISQLAGMRGMMADPSGRIIPLPIRSNFREGLSTLEYFISTHGSRKGLADTALRTADAGYLTRRLVDVVQDVIVIAEDCGTDDYLEIHRDDNVGGQTMGQRIWGRIAAERVVDPETGEVIVEKGELIERRHVRRIMASKIESVKVRSPLTCELPHGVCAQCYGMDLGRGKMVEVGTAVGIIAAQSIGEPGTQLTLRTFHTGGVAGEADITSGLPRVEELLEARKQPKGEAVVAEIGGQVQVLQSERYADMRVVRVVSSRMEEVPYLLDEGWKPAVEDGTGVKEGDVLAVNEEGLEIKAQHNGRVRIEGNQIILAYEVREEAEYEIPSGAQLTVKNGDIVEPGQPLTRGSLNPHKILRIRGRRAVELYLLSEVQGVYRQQGQDIHDKHFEIIIRQMLSRVQITHPGDSGYLPGDMVNRIKIRRLNEKLRAQGKRPARYKEVLLGITKAALSTDSFLSAASFQHTLRVLASAAIAGAEDRLIGLKENVIIGKLIPAGTGFDPKRFEFVLKDDEVDEESGEEAGAPGDEEAAAEEAPSLTATD